MNKGCFLNRNRQAVGLLLFSLTLLYGLTVFGQSNSNQKEAPFFDSKISDHPSLKLTADKRNWPPIKPPDYSQNKIQTSLINPQATLVYDVKTKTVNRFVQTENKKAKNFAPASLNNEPAFASFPENPIQTETIFPPDERIKISPTNEFPWRTICKLYITFPDGNHFVASGAIIGRDDRIGFHCLTAAHCVYRKEYGGWALKVEVIPALDNDYTPFYSAWSDKIRTEAGWIEAALPEHDWACITLDRKIGNFTGWMDRYTTTDLNWYKQIVHAAGYPTDLDFGLSLYYDSDSCRFADEFFLEYDMDIYDGQDGMPIWVMEGNRRQIVAIHTGNDGNGRNRGVRLNAVKSDSLYKWIHDDTPPPIDLPDLVDDGQKWANFEPDTVVRGFTQFKVMNDVRNIGTKASGPLTIAYYASPDADIEAEKDILIGTKIMESLPPFYWRHAQFSGIFPEQIIPGKYYIGWIIDPDSLIDEFNELNNVAMVSSKQVIVIDPYIKLKKPSGKDVFAIGANNLIQWYTAGGSGLVTIDVSFDNGVTWQNLVTNLTDSGSYEWKIPASQLPAFSCLIRLTDSFKNLSDCSPVSFIIETPPLPPGVPTDEGIFTNKSDVIFTWTGGSDPETGISDYHIQIGAAPDWNNILDAWTGNELTYRFTGSHNQKLYARVQSKNGVGLVSSWSAASDGILIDLTAPVVQSPPVDQGEYNGSDSVLFSWAPAIDEESGIVDYHLQVGSAIGLADLFDGWIGNTLQHVIVSYQTQKLFARIRAKNGAEIIGDWSEWSDGIIVDMTPPSAPGKPYSEAQVVNFYDIPFYWDPATDDLSEITNYQVKVIDVNANSKVVFEAWVGNVLQLTVPGRDGQALLCFVQAQNKAGLVGPWATADEPVLVQLTPALLTLIKFSRAYEYEGWENAIDNDIIDWDGTVTIYASNQPPPYAIFGFLGGGIGRLEKIKLLTDTKVGLKNRWVTHFRILYSITGIADSDFIPLLTAEKHGGDWEEYVFPEQVVRFIKLVIDKPDALAAQYCQLGEFQAFGRTEYVKTDKADIQIKSGTPTDPNETWSNAIDGDIEGWDGTTTALTIDPPAYVIFNFADQSIKNITKIRMMTDTGVRFKSRWLRDFHIEVSTTGIRNDDFTTVFSSAKTIGDWESFYFDPVPAKYIKLVLDRPRENEENYCQIGEVELYTESKPLAGNLDFAAFSSNYETPTNIALIPQAFSVEQNYPNPFNPETTIGYQLPIDARVSLKIYNMRGQEILSLVNDFKSAGCHTAVWKGCDAQGNKVPSGIYLYRFSAGNFEVTRKMVLLE